MDCQAEKRHCLVFAAAVVALAVDVVVVAVVAVVPFRVVGLQHHCDGSFSRSSAGFIARCSAIHLA